MNVCAVCQRDAGVAPLHDGASEQLCGRCIGRLAQHLPRMADVFSPTVKPPVDALDPDATASTGAAEAPKRMPPIASPEDVETHLDLAIAYREMGLASDALQEFSIALEHARGKLLARALNALFGKGSGWKRDLRALRDRLYPA